MSNVLVYAEHAHGKLPKATAVAVTAAKEAAAKMGGGDVILALFGSDISALTEEGRVRRFHMADDTSESG